MGDNAQLAAELAAEDDDDDNMMLIIGIVAFVIIAALAGVFFMRRGGNGIVEDKEKEFPQTLMAGQFKAFQPTHVEAQVGMGAQQPVAPVQPVAQPTVVAEPAVVQQWTDANGNTWRSMDNGTTLWWNGTDWQQA